MAPAGQASQLAAFRLKHRTRLVALLAQRKTRRLAEEQGVALANRIGIHVGEIVIEEHAERVRFLKREMTLFRLLKERVGEHPHLVRLHDFYLEEPPYYVEMDYVEGKDLAHWCEEQEGVGKIPIESRIRLVAEAAEGLQAAHEAGIMRAATVAAVLAVMLTLLAGIARQQSFRANSEAAKAFQAAHAEKQERVRAGQERQRAEDNLYAAMMSLAREAWEKDDMARLRQLLEETANYPKRGFEWYYCQRELHREVRAYTEDVVSGVELKAGINTLVLKIVNETDESSGSIWLTDGSDQPIKGIQVTVSPD